MSGRAAEQTTVSPENHALAKADMKRQPLPRHMSRCLHSGEQTRQASCLFIIVFIASHILIFMAAVQRREKQRFIVKRLGVYPRDAPQAEVRCGESI